MSEEVPAPPTWEPIEQDWGHKKPVDLLEETSVRVVPAAETAPEHVVDPKTTAAFSAVTGPLRQDLAARRTTPADEAKTQILNLAYCHAERAANEIAKAVAWFGVVDRSDHADIVRQVEGLADTIAYRLRNAGG